ncbi:MAG: hypothetical protein JRH11_09045 [Deltaproteobacteria bacterium]|nr:hypothetical protein [Deltaproteobacteria bacterium]
MDVRSGMLTFAFVLVSCLSANASAQDTADGGDADEAAVAAGEADSEARAIYVAGRVAFDEGRYQEALARFQEAHERSQRPELLYNIGMAADRLRLDDVALAAFEEYLAEVTDAQNRVPVENRIRALREAAVQPADDVPSPAETAAASETGDDPTAEAQVSSADDDLAGDHDSSILTSWWFWTLVGVLVVGGVVTGAAVAASAGSSTQAPMPGDFGIVVMALENP